VSILVIHDVLHWRRRAEAMRTMADDTFKPETKAKMLRIAQDYDVLAERAEQASFNLDGARGAFVPTGFYRHQAD
jgi:hypothetical protein